MGVRKLVAVGFRGETERSLASQVEEMRWVRVGQLEAMIGALKDMGAQQCVMVGQIAPRNLFHLRPDARAFRLLARLRERNAQTLFGAIGEELLKDGLELITALPWLRPLMPGEGFELGIPADPTFLEEARFGLRIAHGISALEVGQTVVVKEGTVLAVEGFEGTDACLKRGAALSGKDRGAVAAKVAREGHDMRFDIPCIGPRTLKTLAKGKYRGMVMNPGRTLVLEEPTCRRIAERAGLTLVTLA